MKIAYLDSSVLLSLIFEEKESKNISQKIKSFDQVVSSSLLEAEIFAAVKREKYPLEKISNFLDSVDFIFPNRSLKPELERIFFDGYLRGADAFHLACALYLEEGFSPIYFLSLDKRQNQVASTLGLETPLEA